MNAEASHCCLEAVLLSNIPAERATLLATCFTENERKEAEALPNRSLAGRVAAKRAVCRLLTDDSLTPKDIVIAKNKDGVPRICSPQSADVFISISHSKTAALGLAARTVRRKM